MANPTSAKSKPRCKATEGAQQCLRERHNKAVKHTWGAKGETAQWNADGTPKTATMTAQEQAAAWGGVRFVPANAGTPKTDPDLAAEARRRVAEEEARLRRTEAMLEVRVKSAWFDPSPDAPTTELPTVKPADRPQPAALSGVDLLLAEVDQDYNEHIRQISDRYLLDLGLAELDHQLAELDKAAARFVAEVDGRTRFLDFADAAAERGHHPAAAYCYAADRFDPEGAAS